MKLSPVQLLEVVFERINIELDEQHFTNQTRTFKDSVFEGLELSVKIGLAKVNDTHELGTLHQVTVRVTVENRPEPDRPEVKFLPYKFDVEAAALILLNREVSKLDEKKQIEALQRFGGALAWAAIREQIWVLTSRMRAGPVMLPTVGF